MQAQFSALQARVAALNAQLAQMINLNKAVDPSGFQRLSKAAQVNSDVFRNAAASTGRFNAEQVRVNSATDEYVKKLNAQKMGFREMARMSKVATAAYREQLAMEKMLVRRNPASSMHGRDMFDVVWPNQYAKSVDNAGNRLRWFNAQLRSGATQMVNWGKNMQWSGRQLSMGLTMPVVAFGAAAAVMAYKVDKEFTRISKVYDTTANRLSDLAGYEAEVAQLRVDGFATARKAAQEYQASIEDTLGVQAELAATGQTGIELQKNTAEVMRIATLGELDRNVATESAIALQSIFRMSNQELTESFNLINATENATSLQTKDFAAAIPIAANTVKAFGGDIKELGILMTAMKERGVGATEGANALKATMQRLGRPSKQVREEFQAMTGTSITDLVDQSSSLTEIFTKLYYITKDMEGAQKRDVFAGLFGSYQVTRLMGLTEGMGELEQGIGQVSEAARVAGKSTEDLANIAAGELKAIQESASGQFKSAWEDLKATLAETGGPFLKAGAKIVGIFRDILSAVNEMPDFAKSVLGWSMALAALAGPVIMMTGLFAVLGGSGLKMIAGLIAGFTRLTTGMVISDRQTRIHAAAARMAETQHVKNTTAINNLTSTMRALEAAQIAANTASKNQAVASQVDIRWTKARSLEHKRLTDQLMLEQRMLAHYGMIAKNGQTILRDPAKGPMASISRANAMAGIQHVGRVQNVGQAQTMAMAQNSQMNAAAAAQAKATAAATAKTQRNMAGGAVAGGAMAASMALMMLSTDKTTQNLAKWTMIGALVVPMAIKLFSVLAKVVIASRAYAINMAAGASATNAAAAASLRAGMAGLFSKANLLAVGLAAAAYGAFLLIKHFRNIKKEQMRIDKANGQLISQTERWAAATGKALDGYKRLTIAARSGADNTEMTDRVNFYRSEEEKENTESFNDMGASQQDLLLSGKYIDMVQGMGMSAADAKDEIQAFLIATGQSFAMADQNATMLSKSMATLTANGVTANEWANEFRDVLDGMDNITAGWSIFSESDFEVNKETLAAMGEQAGTFFAQAFTRGTGQNRKEIYDALDYQIAQPWKQIAEEIGNDSVVREEMKTAYELTDGEVEDILSSGEKMRDFYMGLTKNERNDFAISTGFEAAVKNAEALERVLISGVAKSLGVIGKDVDTLGELMGDAAVVAETFGDRIGEGVVFDKEKGFWRASVTEMEQAMAEVDEKYTALMGKSFEAADRDAFEQMLTDLQTAKNKLAVGGLNADEEEQLAAETKELDEFIQLLYAVAELKNIEIGSDEFYTLINVMSNTKDEAFLAEQEIKNVGKAVDGLPSGKSIKIDIDVNKDIMKNAWGEVMQGAGDILSDDFDSRMDASLEGTDAYWDKRSESLDAEMDNRSNALEAKWEKRKDGAEKYWDNRLKAIDNTIKAEEKAEEKRQKMFDAEMERIDRLTKAANTNIDFNIALNSGNLDEAAKISNDMQAEEGKFVLENAAGASQDSSDKKTERLDNKSEDLEAQRDAAMKAMEKREEMEKRHLDKIADMRKKSLEADAAAAKKAAEVEWEQKKEAHDAAIELLLSGVARSKDELKAMMEHAGIKYETFRQALKDKGYSVNKFIGETLAQEVEKSAIELRSNAAWGELGRGAMMEMIRAMGFDNQQQWQHFIKTGEMKQFETKPGKPGGVVPKGRPGEVEIDHAGGWAGAGGSGRKGVARTLKGLHNSEVMVQAQRGEFIVNKKAAAANPELLEAVNSGQNIAAARRRTGTGGAGIVAGTVLRSLMFGMMKNIGLKAKSAQKSARQQSSDSGGGFSSAGFVQGQGGWNRPAPGGYGWGNTHDYQAPVGTPIYAVSDGIITDSRAITSGGSAGNGTIAPNGMPYRSYGETIGMRDASGNIFRAAHLSSRYVGAGQSVKGGALIGRSGITGNSSGPHIHFDVNGNYNASGYLASRGIPLKKGAAEIMVDNLPATLHKGEGVLTKDLNQKFHEGVNNFANGQSVVYDIDINGEGLDSKEIVREVMREIDKKEGRKTQSRTVGKRP